MRTTTTWIDDDFEIGLGAPPESRRAGADATTAVAGYAILFNSLSENLGGFRERVDPRALDRLRIDPDVQLLASHGGLPIAWTKNDTLALRIDSTGLFFTARLNPEDPQAKSVLEKVIRGDAAFMSFGFYARRDRWGHVNGQSIRTLLDVDVFELSVVARPAYKQTAIGPASGAGARSVSVARAHLRVLEASCQGGAAPFSIDLARRRLRLRELESTTTF